MKTKVTDSTLSQIISLASQCTSYDRTYNFMPSVDGKVVVYVMGSTHADEYWGVDKLEFASREEAFRHFDGLVRSTVRDIKECLSNI